MDLENDSEIARHNLNIDALRLFLISGMRPMQAAFSPDGSTFLAAVFAGGAPWAFDLNKHAVIPIGDPLKSALSSQLRICRNGSERDRRYT